MLVAIAAPTKRSSKISAERRSNTPMKPPSDWEVMVNNMAKLLGPDGDDEAYVVPLSALLQSWDVASWEDIALFSGEDLKYYVEKNAESPLASLRIMKRLEWLFCSYARLGLPLNDTTTMRDIINTVEAKRLGRFDAVFSSFRSITTTTLTTQWLIRMSNLPRLWGFYFYVILQFTIFQIIRPHVSYGSWLFGLSLLGFIVVVMGDSSSKWAKKFKWMATTTKWIRW